MDPRCRCQWYYDRRAIELGAAEGFWRSWFQADWWNDRPNDAWTPLAGRSTAVTGTRLDAKQAPGQHRSMVFKWLKPSDDPAIAARIPPGQVLTDKFPVLHFGRTPEYPALSRWDFRAFGEAESPFNLRWAEFRALPSTTVTLDIHCVTRWSKLDTGWEGVPFSHIAEVAQPRPQARFVIFHSEAGFTSNVPLEVAMDPQCILAWNYAGKPLEPDHGYPLRAIVPGKYFWKSAKWLRGVEFSTEDKLGFWERNGYSNSADPWREERYSDY